MSEIRCRIAPSPSGFLHIGTAKIALFNWLFARSTGGTFVLRLEDTDAERTDETYVQAMCDGFHWLGIHWDEGPEFGSEPERGDYRPYRQSQRRQIHVDAAHRLLESGKAYKCFCTKEELEAMREKAAAEKRPPRYEGTWRDASQERIDAMGNAPYVVRFRVPEGETVIHDIVQGDVRVKNTEFDDFVILKGNGDPIFHLAVVVDDATMKISHVIRGDDHLTNAARHVMLFEALGEPVPQFAHLPMVLDDRGKKFSKREHGANVLDWRDDGYLPEALINYVALLGWTPEEAGRELFSMEELKHLFRIERWGKSAARFDRKKLDWLNGQHIRRLALEEFRDRVTAILVKQGFPVMDKPEAWRTRMAEICQEKLATLNQIVEYTDFFFGPVTSYDEKAVRKQWQNDEAAGVMELMIGAMESVGDWTSDHIKAAYEQLGEQHELGLGKLVHPTRLALTGKSVGPGLFELAELLGKHEALARMRQGLDHIRNGIAAT
ncbi:MAG: glutamate--tRNA ligase [Candidatus Hydrogenedens sp.]|nr:glutamate--tRNA ligase [Candidatus Hydrogenedens sp.]